ncbi:hypothetical protein R6M68_14080, partial [Staphylococcus aureus]
IIISVICCLAITGILMYTLDGFYNSLTGILSILIKISPFTIVISAILYILTAIVTVQATKHKFQ